LKDGIIDSVILSAGTSLVSHHVLNRCECFCVVRKNQELAYSVLREASPTFCFKVAAFSCVIQRA
jgi:hypothetical protein